MKVRRVVFCGDPFGYGNLYWCGCVKTVFGYLHRCKKHR